MTRKDIYVFKAKFGVGNFEIEVYKLPVKKETAKAYFVDDHYTYRKKVLKEEIGITKELISEIMVVYLEENDFAKARSIFAAHNMERLEDTKKKIENTFQNGKIYNCDLSAAQNIGARFFLREYQKKGADGLPSTPLRTLSTLREFVNNGQPMAA